MFNFSVWVWVFDNYEGVMSMMRVIVNVNYSKVKSKMI